MASTSATALRERGNDWYTRSAEAECADKQLSCLTVARDLYKKSLRLAGTADDYASAHKNLGATFTKLAQLTPRKAERGDLLRQSVLHKCQAYDIGNSAYKGDAWLSNVLDGIKISVDVYIEDAVAAVKSNSSHICAAVQSLEQLHTVIPEELCE